MKQKAPAFMIIPWINFTIYNIAKQKKKSVKVLLANDQKHFVRTPELK